MAKKKGKPKRRFYKKRKRRGNPKIPFETLIAGASIPFTPAQPGWQRDWILSGNIREIMNQLQSGFLGMDINTGRIDLLAALNPLNFDKARFTKMLLFASLLGMARRKIIGRYTSPLFKKIPLIGRWVS